MQYILSLQSWLLWHGWPSSLVLQVALPGRQALPPFCSGTHWSPLGQGLLASHITEQKLLEPSERQSWDSHSLPVMQGLP